ncbi:recombinase family protein (plasmid) [Vibrio parahaemolyticus]|uniref:recombinase family protein n=1 Tax=Vibrio parahaemolyticus TaxID=670 RepID=UPI00205681AB|nr:recombinase family protein [Vibrio parahaemolyticus]UJX11854.1 recombinase family protein [Vibrio parahaemolyticus]UJX16452.1 recombinase family protein [Vibrio parahaemolyticus]UPR18971.1 recombinase family protein [Vibrio parahaemolyticus]UPR23822.1 recombinase family protein [Vibrio parahaemolyticus]
MFIRAYLRASTTDQDAERAKNELQAFAHEHNVRIASFYTEQLSGAKLGFCAHFSEKSNVSLQPFIYKGWQGSLTL